MLRKRNPHPNPTKIRLLAQSEYSDCIEPKQDLSRPILNAVVAYLVPHLR